MLVRMRRMRGVVFPRRLKTILLAADETGVHVTWTFGNPVEANPVEFFTYGVEVTGNRGSFIKRYAVKFVGTDDPEVFPFVHDFMSGTQSNFGEVTIADESITVHFPDSDLGGEPVDAASGYSNVNGVDVVLQFPVTVVD